MTIMLGGSKQIDVFHVTRQSGGGSDLSNYLLGISQQATTSTSSQKVGCGYDFKTNTGLKRMVKLYGI